MKVYVVMYSHRYGEDIEVFSNEESAMKRKDDIARENWSTELGVNKPMQEKNIGDVYFDTMLERGGEEYFNIQECEVQS